MSRLNHAPMALILAALLWVGSAAAAQAQEKLFAVDGAAAVGAPSSLYELSPTTGAVISTGPGGTIGGIGAIGFSHVVAIDFDPTAVLYGVSNTPAGAGGGSTLITISPTTGVGAFVAGITEMTACAFGDNISDMSFDSSGTLYVWRACAKELYTVSIPSGVATLIGSAPIPPFLFQVGLAFDSSDTLYLKSEIELWTVSTTTAALSSPILFGGFGDSANMLAFDMADLLYTGTRGGGSPLKTLGTPPPPVTTPPFGTLSAPIGLGTGIPGLAGLAFDGMLNYDPVCSAAVASRSELWPPNHAWTPVSVMGVTDPDGDFFLITIDAIRQDEPLNGRADGNTAPDASGLGTSVAMLRAERSSRGNGRVYEIDFTATDVNGASCTGTVEVGVRRDQGRRGGPAVNDGATIDSTGP